MNSLPLLSLLLIQYTCYAEIDSVSRELQEFTSNSTTLFQPGRLTAWSKQGPVSHNKRKSGSVHVCNEKEGKFSAFRGNVLCVLNATVVFIGHCLSFVDNDTQQRLNIDYTGYVLARCPFYAGTKVRNLSIAMHSDLPNLNHNSFCHKLTKGSHREGHLCGKCRDGYGVSILSPSYNCKNCTKVSSLENYLRLVGLTILPATLLFLVVIVFHIGLTSAPTNGYIFFSHVVTIHLNILIFESAWSATLPYKDPWIDLLSKLLLYPLYMWNLDFTYYIKADVACLAKNIKIMHIIFMQYFYALYPMVLLLLALILIQLHGRNCKLVVLLWKPFCYLCVRLRRNWNVRTSLVDAFATWILLSYSKLVGTSFALISPNPVYSPNDTHVYNTLHYDVETIYLSLEHLPFFIIAIIMLVTFGLLPPLLLIFYPFRWFQKLLNALRLNRQQCLYIFLDAFQGCYKNGTGGTPDRRYFAGFYFVFRIIIWFVHSCAFLSISHTTGILSILYLIFFGVVALFQPYKNNFYNILDGCIFLILTITNINFLYANGYVQIHNKLPPGVWPVTYALLLLPATYMTVYVLYWILTRFRARCCQRCMWRRNRIYRENDYQWRYEQPSEPVNSSPTHTSLDSVTDSFEIPDTCSFPDRLNNPYRYSDREEPVGLFREHSSLLMSSSGQRTRAKSANYGAFTH